MEYRAIKMSPQDNVAIAVAAIPKGATVNIPGYGKVVAKQEVPDGHKIALVPIPRGLDVIRYGEAICSAKEDISAGDLVHLHNTISTF